MAERSMLPIYGNVARFTNTSNRLNVVPRYFESGLSAFDSVVAGSSYIASVARDIASNRFTAEGKSASARMIETPFYTENVSTILELLSDTVHKQVERASENARIHNKILLHSQPTDSLLKPMMHRSDNFFAEQSLLMVSNEKLGIMNDAKIIDSLLKTDLKDLPQKPRWVDGSGLSRYNLFTPQDFVFILNKIRTEFGMERIKEILPTGNEGTLSNYYKAENGYLFAKTGTLSGVVALSGFLYTKKDRLLIFSVLVNNHQTSAAAVRRAVEKFVEELYQKR
jgi:D-alanyl-D-alanine carboxypeptidase/D-alanyl-D-alanine-endopeptidase (penicillin-binding protein 4)